MTTSDVSARFRAFVERENLFGPTDRILLAASGGLDSTTLAHLLHREGYTFALAHCNYQLRGAASAADAAFVEDLARQLKVPLHTTTVTLASAGQDGSIQEEARNSRYEYFRKTLDEYNFTILCTAHHLDDSLETMLINLVRGTGITGIRGIAPRTDFPTARPLLDISRQEILRFAQSEGIRWREDGSNQEFKYQRNAIRHRVVPLLRELGLEADSLRTTLAHLRSSERFVDRGIGAVPGVEVTGEETTVQRGQTGLTAADTLTLLHHLTAGKGFTPEQLRQLRDATRSIVLHSPTHRADADGHRIRIAPTPRGWDAVTIDSLPRTISLPQATVVLDVVDYPDAVNATGIQYCRLPELPLHLRPRQDGDRFQPYGMGGRSKKIQDVLTDDKVPAWEKDQVPLLCDARGQIVAIAGHRIAHAHALTGSEERVLRIRIQTERPGSS